MTDLAAAEFRQPSRYVRLDTILRLRWLAVLGQIAAVFIVSQGLNFDFAVVPCLVIIALSALLNLAVQSIFNPMQRLEPVWAAVLLALNIVELAGLLFMTGGLQNPFSFLFLAPVLISATAPPARNRARLCRGGLRLQPRILPLSAAVGFRRSAGAAADLSVRRLALITLAISVTSLYAFGSPRKPENFPTRWPPLNWCWRASASEPSSTTGSPPPPPTNSARRCRPSS
jgi:hypothetical protein